MRCMRKVTSLDASFYTAAIRWRIEILSFVNRMNYEAEVIKTGYSTILLGILAARGQRWRNAHVYHTRIRKPKFFHPITGLTH